VSFCIQFAISANCKNLLRKLWYFTIQM
jgi:hypothetical protein